jgi:hypothetical protein
MTERNHDARGKVVLYQAADGSNRHPSFGEVQTCGRPCVTADLRACIVICLGLWWLATSAGCENSKRFSDLREYRPVWVLCPLESRFPSVDRPWPDSTIYPRDLFPRGEILIVEGNDRPAVTSKNLPPQRDEGKPGCRQTAFRIDAGGSVTPGIDVSTEWPTGSHRFVGSGNPDWVYGVRGWTCLGPPRWIRERLVGGGTEDLGNLESVRPLPRGKAFVTMFDRAGDMFRDSVGTPHPLGLYVQDTGFTPDSLIVIGTPPDSLQKISHVSTGGPLYVSLFSLNGTPGRRTRVGKSGVMDYAVVCDDHTVVFSVCEGGERLSMVAVCPDGTVVTRPLGSYERCISSRGPLICTSDNRAARLCVIPSLFQRPRFRPTWGAFGCRAAAVGSAVLVPGDRVAVAGRVVSPRSDPGCGSLVLGVFDLGGRPRGRFVNLPGSGVPEMQRYRTVTLACYEPGWLLVDVEKIGLALYDVRDPAALRRR